MIFNTTSTLSPKTEITIDKVPVNYLQILRIEVEVQENMHDLATVEFGGLSPDLMHLYIDTPIYIKTYVDGAEPFEFYGYIVFLDPTSETLGGTVDGSPFQITRAYCLGASYKMRYKRFKVWENKTISDIAKDIAKDHQLSVSVPDDPYVFPRLMQSEESDWAFLIRVSNELGYNVRVLGTNIHIWDPYRAMSRKVSFSRLQNIKATGGDVREAPGQILSFEARVGNVTPEGARSSDVLFALDENNNIISATNKDMLDSASLGTPVPTTFSNVMSSNATSYAMAKKKTTAALRKKFPLTATAKVSAETSAQPGGIAFIESYDSQFEGFWYIRSVKHTITQSSMVTVLSMAKDALGPLKTPPIPTSEYEAPPNPAIVNSRWVSTYNKVNVYS